MSNNLIPFYTYNEKDRLGYSLFVDMQTKETFRFYDETGDFFSSGKYWVYYYVAYFALSQLKGIQLFMSSRLALIVYFIVSAFGFCLGYFYLYNKKMNTIDFKTAYLTKDEFVSYAKKGRKTFNFVSIVLVVSSFIFILCSIAFVFRPSITFLLFVPLISFIISLLMRSIPYCRFQLHYNQSFLNQISEKIHKQMIS